MPNPPQIAPVKVPENLEEGQRLVIVCIVLKGSQPISFSWRKDNVPLVSSPDMKVMHTDSYQEQLQIEQLNADHVGNYTCGASNAFGSDQMSVAVALKFVPRWMENGDGIQTIIAVQGQSVQLNCSAKGYPTPIIKILRGM
ncbi:hemicentin-2-like [Tropilaelaps mercedesae]|uniref:Hemicentin-2-like n=1 Tax=Tropilaelaps mercedesae TaxID=418985 RepID=A0A1V9Y0D1_9ACAR|nr:hemicentin-2-like [Tropilaelaps mercedesae]